MSFDRRRFLAGSVACAGSAAALRATRGWLPTPTDAGDRVLVVVQLGGGNDGINTVVPFADDGYGRNRDALRLPRKELLHLDDHVGLHPALQPLMRPLEDGRLCIVQGVGYARPDRSHFRSMAIWHSGRRDPSAHDGLGWLGRALDRAPRRPTGDPAALFIGTGAPPVAVRGARAAAASLESLDDFALTTGADPRAALAALRADTDLIGFVQRSLIDACQTADRIAALRAHMRNGARYPRSGLGQRLGQIAQLLECGHGARVYYTEQTGYDMHAGQLPRHSALLSELAEALTAFIDDLAAAGLDQRVLVLVFSEFGRTLRENASTGTDHGTAGPVLVLAPRVATPLFGRAPDLIDLEDGEPKASIDFRRIYASVLGDWLGIEPGTVVGPAFAPLPLLG